MKNSLDVVAGYYQEKYDNTIYAIIAHIAGNSVTVIALFMMSIKKKLYIKGMFFYIST